MIDSIQEKVIMSNQEQKPQINSPALWTAEECYSFLNIGRSSWYAGVAEGRFPKPVYLGPRMSRWKREDVLALLEGAISCVA